MIYRAWKGKLRGKIQREINGHRMFTLALPYDGGRWYFSLFSPYIFRTNQPALCSLVKVWTLAGINLGERPWGTKIWCASLMSFPFTRDGWLLGIRKVLLGHRPSPAHPRQYLLLSIDLLPFTLPLVAKEMSMERKKCRVSWAWNRISRSNDSCDDFLQAIRGWRRHTVVPGEPVPEAQRARANFFPTFISSFIFLSFLLPFSFSSLRWNEEENRAREERKMMKWNVGKKSSPGKSSWLQFCLAFASRFQIAGRKRYKM